MSRPESRCGYSRFGEPGLPEVPKGDSKTMPIPKSQRCHPGRLCWPTRIGGKSDWRIPSTLTMKPAPPILVSRSQYTSLTSLLQTYNSQLLRLIAWRSSQSKTLSLTVAGFRAETARGPTKSATVSTFSISVAGYSGLKAFAGHPPYVVWNRQKCRFSQLTGMCTLIGQSVISPAISILASSAALIPTRTSRCDFLLPRTTIYGVSKVVRPRIS